MPMSGSFRHSEPPHARRGFTLLELLIVLALVAMVAAMVAPRLQHTYDAVVRSGDRAEVVRQVERLPVIARGRGQPLVIPPDDEGQAFAQLLELPQGWILRALEPLRIEASGVCHPARIQVEGGGVTEEWHLSAPACGVLDAS